MTRVIQLLRDASDSPVTDDQGSATQLFGGALVSYSFWSRRAFLRLFTMETPTQWVWARSPAFLRPFPSSSWNRGGFDRPPGRVGASCRRCVSEKRS
jgi:hypothetical protein